MCGGQCTLIMAGGEGMCTVWGSVYCDNGGVEGACKKGRSNLRTDSTI